MFSQEWQAKIDSNYQPSASKAASLPLRYWPIWRGGRDSNSERVSPQRFSRPPDCQLSHLHMARVFPTLLIFGDFMIESNRPFWGGKELFSPTKTILSMPASMKADAKGPRFKAESTTA